MKKITKLIVPLFILSLGYAEAQVGIGTTTPDASAMLEIKTTNKGLLLPRLTTLDRDAIVLPAKGLVLFNLTSNALETNTGTTSSPIWTASGIGASGANGTSILNGNSNPNSTTGSTGDFYINTTTNILYGPKINEQWPTNGIQLGGNQESGVQLIANLSTNITNNSGSNTMYPSVLAIENYVNASATPDATNNLKGKIKLAGDLEGTADAPKVAKLQGTSISTAIPTTGQLLKFDGTNWVGVDINAVVRMESQQITPSAPGQVTFTTTLLPLGKLSFFINGIRVPTNAVTLSGTNITYIPSNNDNYNIKETDRISFDYVY